MNVTIERECSSLKEYAQKLCKEIVDNVQFTKTGTLSVILPESTTSHVSNPDRPWKIAGGVAIAAGVLTIISSNSFWGYLLGAGGLASFYIGTTKTPSKANKQTPSNTCSSFSGLELSEKILEVTKEIETKWRNKIEEVKNAVQRAIASSAADDSLKQSLMGETYYTERINFDVSSYVERLAVATDEGLANRTVREYVERMRDRIQAVCHTQVEVYMNISKKL